MRHEILVGVERRRRWSIEQKLQILSEVGVDGATVADVARRHDVTRQHIYQWRREMRRKREAEDAPCFLAVGSSIQVGMMMTLPGAVSMCAAAPPLRRSMP